MKLSVPIFLAGLLVATVLSEKLDESSNVLEGKVEKKDKRGLFGLGYAYGGASNYGTLGGYSLGSTIASSYPQYSPIAYEAPLPHFPASVHTTITKHVPIAIEKPVPVPVHIPVPQPYPVERIVDRPVHIPVERPVPVPVHVPVPVDRPYAVPVDRPYAVPVDRPYPVPQPYAVPVYKHVPVPVSVAKPLVLPYINKEVYAHHAHSW